MSFFFNRHLLYPTPCRLLVGNDHDDAGRPKGWDGVVELLLVVSYNYCPLHPALPLQVTVEFRITEEAIGAQEILKLRVWHLCACSLGVESSWMGADWAVYQIINREKHPALYGLCTCNPTEQIYDLRHRIWGVHFRLDHDAKLLSKTIREPDDVPNAPMLCWIAWIRLFDLEPNHIRDKSFKIEDALSRRPTAPIDRPYNDQDTKVELVPREREYTHNMNTIQHLPELSLAQFSAEQFDPSLANSYLAYSAPRYICPHNICPLPEFTYHNSFEGITEELLLDSEYISLQYINVSAHTQSISLVNGANSPEFWSELREFLSSGLYPSHCTTDAEKLRLLKRSRPTLARAEASTVFRISSTGMRLKFKPTILWPEAKAYKTLMAHNVASFIYDYFKGEVLDDPKMREADKKIRESRLHAMADLHKLNHFQFDFANLKRKETKGSDILPTGLSIS
ncbi:hypothetical protein GGX14DRAFT_633510 [Mycena pura]|uniref:Uncharacterized protein n=1 Tax=Mycena pura TaxID=153505 RepID=A0AAD6YAL5_9AGAR|nr:hypothetical protein GGX14DRAFT_633510 [Mycena pura]